MKKRISKVLAIACVFALLVGSFAYFTDRVESNANVTAGTVGITQANTWATNLKDGPQDLNNINPGDSRDLTFTVTNTGTKAVDVRHTLKLSVVDAAGKAKALTTGEDWSGFEMMQFDIYKASDVEKMSTTDGWNGGYVLKDDALPVFSSDSVDATSKMGASRDVDATKGTITYYFADSVLDGVAGVGATSDAETGYKVADQNSKIGDALDDTDVAALTKADGSESTSDVTYSYVLIFRDTTLNDFQGCKVYLDLEVEAKQHLNTASSWKNIATVKTTLNASGLADQNTIINVAPDNTIGVGETLPETVEVEADNMSAAPFNTHTAH